MSGRDKKKNQPLHDQRSILLSLLNADVGGKEGLCLLLDAGALLLDTCSLTRELAQVVQLGAAHLTNLVHLDAVNVGRLDGEDTLHTDGTRHFANSETLFLAMAYDLDDHTTVELDALLRTLDNFVSDSNSVTSLELRVLLAGCKCFFSNFN